MAEALGLKPKGPTQLPQLDQKEVEAALKRNAPEEGDQGERLRGLGFA
jgi:hypothetical protein